jgi:hypothetical protein
MFIDDCTFTQNGRTYRRVLLRNSYRVHGKVRHDILANLSHCSAQEIEALKLALKHKVRLSQMLEAGHTLTTKQGLAVGAVWVLHELARRLGLSKALGRSRQAKLALWLVVATVIAPGSRLSAVRLAQRHAACDILGLEAFNEDDLYGTLEWLDQHQAQIEGRLFAHRYGACQPRLYLYDVTSSYFEGAQNELAEYGYNRDGKKGKKQIVVGLLTDEEGWPIAVQVFVGNTPDATTLKPQIEKLARRFGVSEVTLVGDRGMIKSVQLQDLANAHFHYITAITKPQITTLLKRDILQLEGFTADVAEVAAKEVRYLLRRNPQRAEELAAKRQQKLAQVRHVAQHHNTYLAQHPRAQVAAALNHVRAKAQHLRISSWVEVKAEGRMVGVEVREERLAAESRLDGCYVLRTDLLPAEASAPLIHDRYKDLAQVEWAFRTMKTTLLELRPIYVRTAAHTRAHVFIIMLAYLLVYQLAQLWQDVEVTLDEGLQELASICALEVVTAGRVSHQTIPQPRPLGQLLLAKTAITLPEAIPCRNVEVVTRKKLTAERKSH